MEKITEITMNAPLEMAWKAVSDTDRTNRFYNYAPISVRYQEQEGEETRVFVKQQAVRNWEWEWEEEAVDWVEPQWLQIERRGIQGPYKKFVIRFDLESINEKQTQIKFFYRLEPKGPLGAFFCRFILKKGPTLFEAYLAECANQIALPKLPFVLDQSRDFDPQLRVTLEQKFSLSLFEDFPEEKMAFLQYLSQAPLENLSEIRPKEIANFYGCHQEKMLHFLLHSASEGLLDLKWQLLCPHCGGSTAEEAQLQHLELKGACTSCDIDFEADLPNNVEVLLSAAPLGLAKPKVSYCHSGPANTPHRFAALRIQAGEQKEFQAHLAAGAYRTRCTKNAQQVSFEVQSQGDTGSTTTIELEDTLQMASQKLAGENITFHLHNKSKEPNRIFLESTPWRDDSTTAAEISTNPHFRRLCSDQILAPGMRFAIENQVFLFTDLVSSTAMYSTIGDATAFSLVRRHFEFIDEILERTEGVKVKTIGDAVMAVFRDPIKATQAAIEMHQGISSVRDEETNSSLQLCIGLHQGPSILMEANGIIDYFGTTVNTAARVQGKASGGILAMSETFHQIKGLTDLLKNFETEHFQASFELKGLPHPVTLHCYPIDKRTISF